MTEGPEGLDRAAAADAATIAPVRGAATLFGDISALFLSRAATIVLTVASVVVMTRILGPTDYGTYAYVTVIATVVFTVASAWTAPAIIRFGRERLEERGEMVAVTWERLRITTPVVAIVSLCIVVVALAGGLPAVFGWELVTIALAYGVVLVLSDHIVWVLQALGRMKLGSAGIVARQAAVLVALCIVLLVAPRGSVLAVALVTLGGSALLTAAFVPFGWKRALWPPATDAVLRRQLLRFSFPMFAFTLSQYVIQTIDLPLIGIFRGSRDVGLYALAYRAYTVLQQLATVSVAVLTPLFVSMRLAGREHVVRLFAERAVWQVTFLASSAMGLVVPLVPLLVPQLFGARFAGATQPLVILLGATLLLVTANLLAPVLLLHEASASVGLTNGLAAVINIVLDLLLLGVFGLGIWSPAAATVLSVAVIVGGYLRTAHRRSGAVGTARLVALLPTAVALIPALTLDPAPAAEVGVPVVLVVAAAVLVWGRLFRPADAELIAHLDLPRPLRRLVLAGIAFGSRS